MRVHGRNEVGLWMLGALVGATAGLGVAINPLLTIAAALGVVLTMVGLSRPVWAFYVLLIVVPVNDLISQLLHGKEAIVFGAGKDYLLALIVVSALVKRRPAPRFLSAILWWMLGATAVAIVVAPRFTPALYGFRNEVEPALLLISAPLVLTRSSIRRAMTVVLLLGEVSAAVAVLTWREGLRWLERIHLLPPPAGAQFPTSLFTNGSDAPRAFSPYVSADDLAVAMALTLAVVLFYPGLRLRRQLLMVVLPFAAMYLSRSRSGMLDAAVVVLIWLAVRSERHIRRTAPLIVIFGAFVVISVVGWLIISHSVVTNNASTTGHFTSFLRGIGEVARHPLGLGLGTSGPRAVRYYTNPMLVESSFLLMGLELGWIGLAAYVALIYKLLRWLLTAYKTAAMEGYNNSSVILVAATALAGSIVSQLVLPTVQDATVMFLLWAVVACGIYGSMAKEQPIDPHHRPSTTTQSIFVTMMDVRE